MVEMPANKANTISRGNDCELSAQGNETTECASCGCQQDTVDDKGHARLKALQIAAGSILFVAAVFLPLMQNVMITLNILAYAVLAWPVFKAIFSHVNWKTLMDENFLMAVASLGAWAIGDSNEAVAVMLFFRVGEALQQRAVNGARRSIEELLKLRADTAHVIIDQQERDMDPSDVFVGMKIIVRNGERIPLDCLLLSEQAEVNLSALTGESLPQNKRRGEMLLAGGINLGGVIEAEVLRAFMDSEMQKILTLTSQAQQHRAPTEAFITKFARVYTPCVLVMAALLCIIPTILFGNFAFYAHKALSFLVVSCPCALVISVPMAYFGGIGMASRRGLLVKGAEYFSVLQRAKTMVFDKTGTLTKGEFSISQVHPVQIDEQLLLQITSSLEAHSNHPIAKCIAEHEGCLDFKNVHEIAGEGITGEHEGKLYFCGNRRLMARAGAAIPVVENEDTVIYVSRGSDFLGYVVVSDTLRSDAARTIDVLKKLGVQTIGMLTGDREKVAQSIAKAIGIDDVRHSLLPQDKWETLKTYRNKPVLFVGDGINDAPVLAAADAGVAMGGIGQDAAIESADMVLMTDRLMSLCDGILIARRTQRTVWQNIAFALAFKTGVLLLATVWTIPIYLAVFADVGVALLCVLNAALILRMRFDQS